MKESKFGLIPFVNNSYTNHVFSMKYFEYIASYTYPVCSKIPMYDSLNSNLIPKTFLDDETNINSFKSSDLEFMRNIVVLKKYTYNARIKDMIERKIFNQLNCNTFIKVFIFNISLFSQSALAFASSFLRRFNL